MVKARSFLILILFQAFLSPISFGSPTERLRLKQSFLDSCWKYLRVKETSIADKFREAIEKGDWHKATKILQENHKATFIRMKKELSVEEIDYMDGHWAALNTGSIMASPVSTLSLIFENLELKPGSTIVDIGSGHGDPAFVFATLDPTVRVTGFDFVLQKVEGARNMAETLELDNIEFIEQDLSDPEFHLPEADVYYLYNPANREIVEKMVQQVREIAKRRPVKVVSFGSGWTSDIIERAKFREYKYHSKGLNSEIIMFRMDPSDFTSE